MIWIYDVNGLREVHQIVCHCHRVRFSVMKYSRYRISRQTCSTFFESIFFLIKWTKLTRSVQQNRAMTAAITGNATSQKLCSARVSPSYPCDFPLDLQDIGMERDGEHGVKVHSWMVSNPCEWVISKGCGWIYYQSIQLEKSEGRR
jgi:hypothetical protein